MSGVQKAVWRIGSFGLVLAGLLTLVLATAAGGAPGDATATFVADIDPGDDSPADSTPDSSGPDFLFNAGGTLLFAADDGINGTELWKSDGTPAGTVLIDPLSQGGIHPGSQGSNPSGFTSINGTVFFAASTGCCGPGQHGKELWKIGPPYTTPVMVEDINLDPINLATASSNPEQLTNVGGSLLFRADDGNDGEELWKLAPPFYDDAVQVDDINDDPGVGSFPDELTEVNGILFFIADDGGGYEVWKSGPSFTSATMVEDIDPSGTAVPAWLTNVSGTLFFSANNGINGGELWKSTSPNYDAGSTAMVEDINGTAADSLLADLTNVNGTLFFEADDGLNGQELWKSSLPYDAGSTSIININPGPATSASDPDELVDVGATLFFRAHGGSGGTELWKSNGGAVGAGTEMVADINQMGPTAASTPAQITGVAGQVFFRATDGLTGDELWKSAPPFTAATQVGDVNTTPGAGSSPHELTDINGTLFFGANDGVVGDELWKATIEQPPSPPPVAPAAAAPIQQFDLKAAIKKCKKKHKGKAKAKQRKKCIRKAKKKASS